MFTISGCIEMLFRDLPFEERFGAAARAGLKAVEFWGCEGKDLDKVAALAEEHGLAVVACTVGAIDPARREAYSKRAMLDSANKYLYAEIVEETIEAVQKTGIRTVIATVGQALPGEDRGPQHDGIVACLAQAAPVLKKHGFTAVLEPLNTAVNHVGYYLARSDEAFDILRAVNSPNVKLLYDVYHQQITEGNLIQTITENIGLIGHFHIADVPGRHHVGSGEINYKNVFAAIAGTPYSAYVGMELQPTIDDALAVRQTLALI
jgi:hydroxypyruvate isomerase